jgi:hypothetical protein
MSDRVEEDGSRAPPHKKEAKMSILTIAREIASLGDEIAQELSSRAGYRVIDKAVIEERLGQYGIGPEKREKFDEKKPSFWASLSQSREDFLHYLKTIVYSEAVQGNCVLVGRGAFALLGSVPGVVSLRFMSPKHVRVARVREFYKCDERHAEQIINQSDHDRDGFHRYFFGVSWNDPDNFLAVINSGAMTASVGADVVTGLVKNVSALFDKSETDRRLAALNLSQAVITAILYKRKAPIQFLEADVEGGLVTLHGVAASKTAIDLAVAAARDVIGVSEVVSEIQVVQEYASMP